MPIIFDCNSENLLTFVNRNQDSANVKVDSLLWETVD